MPLADRHGQYRFSHRHKHITEGREEGILLKAFQQDFEVNGPSLYRLIRTMLKGWQRYQDHPDKCVRDRYAWDTAPLRTTYTGAVWAMKKWYRKNDVMKQKIDELLQDLYRTYGWKTRLLSPFIGSYAWVCLIREEGRLKKGWACEPLSFVNKNAAALALRKTRRLGLDVAIPKTSPA